MISRGKLAVQVVDLPPDGVDLAGTLEFAELDIRDDGLFAFPTPLSFALTVAPVQDGVLVRGRLEGRAVRVCDRCLEPGEVAVEVADVCHLFEEVTENVIDLTDVVREDILLAFPQGWLCSAECRGLCPRCGCNLNVATCDCRDAAADDDNGGGDDDDPWGPLDELIVRDDG